MYSLGELAIPCFTNSSKYLTCSSVSLTWNGIILIAFSCCANRAEPPLVEVTLGRWKSTLPAHGIAGDVFGGCLAEEFGQGGGHSIDFSSATERISSPDGVA